MGEHAFIGMIAQQSVPIRGTTPLFNNADYKKMQALQASAELTKEITGNVNQYYQRRAEFLTQLEEKRKAQADTDTKKKLTEIENLSLWNSTDPYKLKQGQDKLASFFRFAHFNKSVDLSKFDGASAAKKLQRQTGEKLARIESGKETENTNSPVYLATEFQNPGERDFYV